jgi:DHA1 family multidrug/chloramphenicol efflux transport protein-like MFS transporter
MVGRFVEGAMVASMLVAGYGCIHELYDHHDAIRILALMGSVSVLAPALGPLFGSLVLYISSWRGIFWIIFAWATCVTLCLWRWMPETHPSEKRQPLQLNLLARQYFSILTNLQFMRYMLIFGLIIGGWIAWIAAGPLLIIQNFHYSAIMFGVMQAIIFSAFVVASHQVNFFLGKLGTVRLIQLSLNLTTIGGVFTLIFGYVFPHLIYPFLIAMTLYSYGSALCFAPLNRTIIDSSDAPMGARVALFSTFFALFAAIGGAIAGAFFNGTTVSLAWLIAIAIVLAWLIQLKERQPLITFDQTNYTKE